MKKNIILLFLVQASNYLFPLISLPYLMRILGAEHFGIMAMTQAWVQYMVLFVDYGFNFSATRLISINRHDKNKVNRIYTVTIVSKILLATISLLLFCLLGRFFVDDDFYSLTLWGSGAVIGTVLFPVWLFQGLEKMQGIAIFTVVAKAISILLIFILVKNSNDIKFAVFCQSLGVLVSGFIACIYIKQCKMASFTSFKIKDVKETLVLGFDLFISNIAMSFYTTLNILVVGVLGGPTLAGYFAAADKIRTAAQGLLTPVQQAMFPRVSALVHEGKNLNNIMQLYGKKFILFGLTISIATAILGYPFSQLYYGENYHISSLILLIMSPIPFVVAIGIVYGQWWLIPNDQTKIIRHTYIALSFIHVLIAVIFMHITPTYGVAISVIITESVVSFVFIKKSYKIMEKCNESS